MSAVALLRELLDRRFPDATPVPWQTARPVPTGIPVLDGILPNGGLPRGRVTTWSPDGGGAAACLRAACQAALAGGERAAWVDGAGTLTGPGWDDGPLLFRPPGRLQAIRAAEELARSGGFGVVVLSGAEPQGPELVRLSRAAHEGGNALVMVARNTSLAGVRLASRIEPSGWRWQSDPFGGAAEAREVTLEVQAHALGWSRRAAVRLPVMRHDARLCLDPGLADRRGLPR